MATNPNGIKDRISEIRKMRLGDIADNSHNWRLHPERQRKALSKVYEQVGWAGVPLVYFSEREGGLTFVDGHLRKDESPDLTVRVAVMDLNDTEADILLSTYDPLGGLAEVDIGALAKLEMSIDIGLEDFWPVGELGTLLEGLNKDKEEKETEPQIDKAEELREQYGVELGQIWQLGEHRLAIGDCTDRGVVEGVMGGERVDLCLFTDPPYGVKRDGGFGGFGGFGTPIARKQYSGGWDEERPSQDTFNYFINMAKEALIFGGNFFADILPKSTCWLVWDKLNTMPTFGDCELIWTNLSRKSVKKITFEYNGLIGKEVERFHATQKPLGLISELIDGYVKGTLILDPFLGSGTTMIACENLNRKCRGIEIDPGYAAVSIYRWETHTGQKAELL